MKLKHILMTLSFLLLSPCVAVAYESGSTGSDGAFSPTSDIQLTLPPSGIFNFTDVNVPAGVTVSFIKNANNTPVVILASGDVTIDGTIQVNGSAGGASGSGLPGRGGAGGESGVGGFDGGNGGLLAITGFPGGMRGFGPGGGGGAPNSAGAYASGGGYSASGGYRGCCNYAGPSGTYGSSNLRTLIGGSGGGGGAGNSDTGPGGGGGGGAIAIGASGTVTVNGVVSARGGNAGTRSGAGSAGSGSGGAIRIIATTLSGEGEITAIGGDGASLVNADAYRGGTGRIRLEAEINERTSPTTPAYSGATPNPIFYANAPSLRIVSIGGVAAPANATGYRDVELPGTTTNPVSVVFETINVPLGATVRAVAISEHLGTVVGTNGAVSGSMTLGTATSDINLKNANSSLYGDTSFTITIADASDAAKYSQFAEGETVEKMRVSLNTRGQSETTFITASGKEFTWPSSQVAVN